MKIICKTILSVCCIFFVLFSFAEGSDKTKWHVTFDGGKTLFNATFEQLVHDTLTITSDGTVEQYALQDILRLQYTESSSNVFLTTSVGAVVCGGLGYLLGDMEDTYGKNAVGTSDSKLLWTISGAVLGGVLGGVAGSSSTKNVDYDLQGRKLEEKRSILENVIAEKLMNYSQAGKKADIVYLRKGGTVKGTVVENTSDSSVTVTATDGSEVTYNRSEILMISQNDPAYKEEQSGNTGYGYANNRLHVEIHLGVAIPAGEFGPRSSAAAITGFVVEGRLVIPLNSQTPHSVALQSVTSLAWTFNGLSVDVPKGSGASLGAWTLGFPMTGLRLMTSSTGDYDFFIMAQAGLLIGAFPSINKDQNNYLTSSSSTAFAYRAGMGLVINDKFLFEVNYLASKPEYTLSGRINNIPGSVTGTQPTSIVTITAGIIF